MTYSLADLTFFDIIAISLMDALAAWIFLFFAKFTATVVLYCGGFDTAIVNALANSYNLYSWVYLVFLIYSLYKFDPNKGFKAALDKLPNKWK